jgi:predicted nucleotidyltransferase
MTARRARPPSGRFLLRMPPGLHAALRRAAEEAGISLNDHCVRRLTAPAGETEGAPEAVLRAATRFGEALLGVVVFGSLPRGELREDSDVDLLVVLEDSVELTRELYRAWDEAPLLWGGRPVEPHFVHLPPPGRTVAGLWAEVALDGLVLFARGPELGRRLVRVRRDIASGRVVRRRVHGQPYWVEAA